LLNINQIQNPSVKKLAERYLQCVNDFRQLQWQYPEYLALKYLVLFDPGRKKTKVHSIRICDFRFD